MQAVFEKAEWLTVCIFDTNKSFDCIIWSVPSEHMMQLWLLNIILFTMGQSEIYSNPLDSL